MVCSRSEPGERAGLDPARAGREPQRGWARRKAHKVFALQLAPLGKIQRFKGAEEQQLKPDVGWAKVVGPTCWPAVLGSHIAIEDQMGARIPTLSDGYV